MKKDPVWKRRWFRIAETALIAVLIFVAVTISVVRYEYLIHRVNWALVSIVFTLLSCAFGMLYWAGREDNNYVVLDMLTSADGRADFDRHVILILLALTVWVIVQKVLDEDDVDNLLLGALGIFILKRMADRATDAYKSKPAAPTIIPATGSTQINAPQATEIHMPDSDSPKPPIIVRPRKKAS